MKHMNPLQISPMMSLAMYVSFQELEHLANVEIEDIKDSDNEWRVRPYNATNVRFPGFESSSKRRTLRFIFRIRHSQGMGSSTTGTEQSTYLGTI
jgi:hypothetical protein